MILDVVEQVQRSHQLSTRNTAIIAFLLSDALWFLAWNARARSDVPDASIYDLPPHKAEDA
jgi:hypothetical protein